jgi:tagaturonate reductase
MIRLSNASLGHTNNSLPEKILQFGTGVLLRGLCDYFVDKANKAGVFNGRIVVVKSTDTGSADAFTEQDSLYTVAVRGLENGQIVKENHINSAISRTLSAKTQWEAILKTAQNSDLEIIISNTTEVGIQYHEESIFASPPASFPAKLLAVMHQRFSHFPAKGFIIIPTELIVNNAIILKSILLKLAHFNQLSPAFLAWFEDQNTFCNSLVDRIVPGKPNAEKLTESWAELGYQDELLIEVEAYRLWAIEGDEAIKNKLSFHQTDTGVVIEPDIEIYRELKLRLLNGTHTLSCGLSFLKGHDLVRQAMNDSEIEAFVAELMLNELAPAIPYQIADEKKQIFGNQVIDRFKNPFIDHQLLAISVQYSAKMKARNMPLLLSYYEKFQAIPANFTRGFAAYLLFMKAVKEENGVFYGERNGELYPIKCDAAAVLAEIWQNKSLEEVVKACLENTDLWGTNLNNLKGFAEAIEVCLEEIMVEV